MERLRARLEQFVLSEAVPSGSNEARCASTSGLFRGKACQEKGNRSILGEHRTPFNNNIVGGTLWTRKS